MAFPQLRSRERFFFAQSRKAAKFSEPRMNTESHGFFLRQNIFRVLASLRENLCSTRERKFCFARERPAAKISLRSHKLHVESDRSVTSPVLFFFARSREVFGTTDEHGITRIFLRQSIFFRVLASLRENVKSCVKSNFA